MTREEQIIEAGAYHSCGRRPPKTCGHNMHELAYITRNLSFEEGAKWADEHPKSDMVNKQEFIEKAKAWVKNCFIGPFGEGLADNIANEFVKHLEE